MTQQDGRRPLIPAQEAFEELGQTVVADQSMDALLQRVVELAQGVVPGAQDVSITLVHEERATTVVSTGERAVALDESQYASGFGPCLAAAEGAEVASIPDMRTETRWPEFAVKAVQSGVLSSLSTPIPLRQYALAALNMYATDAAAFDDEAVALATSFASYAGAALANLHLYQSTRALAEQLQTAMESRAVIEQAKGILMAQRRCTADEAFEVLVALSQQSNRKLREVAAAMVESARR